MVGLQLKATDIVGSFDPARHFRAAPAGTNEVDLEQDLVGTVRVLSRGQLSAMLPMVETVRRVPGLTEGGGDLGDVVLGGRVDFTLPGASVVIPGIALSLGLTLPTGRAPEAARYPLATDATGTGAVQGSISLALEQTYGPYLINMAGTVALRGARTVGDVHERQGAQLIGFIAGGYSFKNDAVLALTASYIAELDATINGARTPKSGRAATRLGVAGGYPISNTWRLQGSVFSDLPIRFLGYNQPAGVGLTFMIVRAWM